ncbi:hypothetical protein OOT46_20625 [Aquabacterium sp. A7-Y]|uniref:hypothetical protein n=1 Tax=Aquabacterium sp. A7-Y TaxID=1349605 RepID=UPI00223DA2EB|nr:hypothetical protein [Aquabacterium sp. A7-Y]MCW7540242.1 hypothetical protein [Aquabacterium sp. A7-Y]
MPQPAFWFHPTLDPTLSLPTRRAWYRRLQHQLAALDLAIGTHRAVSVVIGGRHVLGSNDRQQVLSWLMNESPVWAVQSGELLLLQPQAGLLAGTAALNLWLVNGLSHCWLAGTGRTTLCRIGQGATLARRIGEARRALRARR